MADEITTLTKIWPCDRVKSKPVPDIAESLQRLCPRCTEAMWVEPDDLAQMIGVTFVCWLCAAQLFAKALSDLGRQDA